MVTHIGPNGPGECGALQGKCPFGPENHFPTAAEAIAVWEAKLAEEHPPFKTKLRQPEGFAAVEAKRMEAYRILNERMTQEFGQDWPARIALSDPGAQQAYNSYSMTTEGFERQLKGMRFAVKDKAPELADLKKERSMIESWISRRFEGRWSDWQGLRDEPEFDDYRELLDRGEDIGVFLKSIKG